MPMTMPNGKNGAIAVAAVGFAAGACVGSVVSWFLTKEENLETGLAHSEDPSWLSRGKDPKPPAKDDGWVEVYDEPYHKTELDSKYCRVVRFRFPAGKRTLFHRHSVDSFFCFFESARIRNEQLGKPVVEADVTAGTSNGACYCSSPIIHRISNIGKGWMHGLDVEIKHTDNPDYKTGPLPETENQFLIYDNTKHPHGKKMRVYNLHVDAGKKARFSLPFSRLVMCEKGSNIRVTKSDGSSFDTKRIPHTYWWESNGFEGTIENLGDSEYVIMVAEWH
eukprot:CAMPEP_0197539062 /NCGR_PEP_ID=MMETSP1318-20131121/61517_1 /TAXON_ID=552666 /ORGANISM="Partenskyella glossopodia, Strain RCC365" /LENGTH=277 /DNA_ID=CAMNT_0043097667 /DNA_START=6 /DNA_END=839 /DNA_ORIENTATION=+